MSEVAAIMLGMLVFWVILGGGRWLMNRRALHPRPMRAGNANGPVTAAFSHGDIKVDLPAVFRMSTLTQAILYVLLLSPPVAATLLIMDEWDGSADSLWSIVSIFWNPLSLFLAGIIYLLCPYTAWNIYWRRRDFIKFDINGVEYRSAFITGKLVPGRIRLFRGRSWRFDLTDLFRGELATSWFLEIIPMTGNGKNGGTGDGEQVVLDLKAMNLGGKARPIAKLANQVYGNKFLISNELPAVLG